MLLWSAICLGFVACADLSFLHLYVLGDVTDNSLSFHLLTFLQSRAVFPGCSYNGKWCILLIKKKGTTSGCESIANSFYQAVVEDRLWIIIIIFHLCFARSMSRSQSSLQTRSALLLPFYKLKQTWGLGGQLWWVHQGGKNRALSPWIRSPGPLSGDLMTPAWEKNTWE